MLIGKYCIQNIQNHITYSLFYRFVYDRIHPLLDTDKCVTQVNPVSGGSGSGFFSGISGSSNSSTLEIKPCIDQGNTSDTDQDFIFTSVSTGSTNITINVNL